MDFGVLWQTFRTIGVADALDILVVSFFIYLLLRLFEWSKAAAIARGMLILGAFYLIARHFGMVLTTWLFHGFFAVFIIAVIIIFQEEIRRFFERLSLWRWRNAGLSYQATIVDQIVTFVTQCAIERTGALIVLRGREPVDRHMEGGMDLDGKISVPLLMSIFDVHSDGHDGAVLVENGRVRKFGLHLPLSKNMSALTGLGTRHAAALGLAEVSDALCIVVSEQRGTIRIARAGTLQPVSDAVELDRVVSTFLRGQDSRQPTSPWRDVIWRYKMEKASAVVIALALWFIFVQGFKPSVRTYDVALSVRRVPEGLRLAGYSPRTVKVTLSGLERDFASIDPSSLRARVNLESQDAGVNRVTITEDDLRVPPEIRFVTVDPPSVQVQLDPDHPTSSGS